MGRNLSIFHKNLCCKLEKRETEWVKIIAFELFALFCIEKRSVAFGDVTRYQVNYGRDYTYKYPLFLQGKYLEKPGMLVENPNFSTISTDFSTGVFHGEN